MIIYRPIKTDKLTQGFSENLAICKCANGGDFPIMPYIIARRPRSGIIPRGWRLWYKWLGLKGHDGIDHGIAYNGEPLYFPVQAPTTWKAKPFQGNDGGIGLRVISQTPVDGHYLEFLFYHLQKNLVSEGDDVQCGQRIALCNNTGASSGKHLHWRMAHWDTKRDCVMNYDNGYRGSIDFEEWYKNEFVLDAMGIQKKRVPFWHYFFSFFFKSLFQRSQPI